MTQVTLITDSKALNTAINSIATRGTKLDQDIHQAACSCIAHVMEHGDTTVVTALSDALIKAMPRAARTKALITWFSKYSPLIYSDKNKAFRFNKGKDANKFDLDGAMSTPFWTEIEIVPKAASMAALIAYVHGYNAKLLKEGTAVNQADIALLLAEVNGVRPA